MDKMDRNMEASNELSDEKDILETDLTMQILAESPKIAAGSTVNLSEVNADKKKKKKRKRNKKKATIKEEVRSMDQNKSGSTENDMEKNDAEIMDEMDGEASNELTDAKNVLETDLTMQTLTGSPKIAAGSTEIKEEAQSMNQNKTGSTENPTEGSVNAKGKSRAKNRKETQSMDQDDDILNLPSSHAGGIDGKLTENMCIVQETESSVRKEPSLSDSVHDKENPLNFCKHEETVLLTDVVELSTNSVSFELIEERVGHLLRHMEVEEEFFSSESQHNPHPNQTTEENVSCENRLNEVNDAIIVDLGKCPAEGRSVVSTCDVAVSTHLASLDMKEAVCLSAGDNVNCVNDAIIVDLEKCPAEGRSVVSTCDAEVTTHLSCLDMKEAECLSIGGNANCENGLSEVNDVITVDMGKCPVEGRSVFSTSDVEVTTHLSSLDMKEAEYLSTGVNANCENWLSEVNDAIIVDLGKCPADVRRMFSTCDVEVTTHLPSLSTKEAECLSKDLGQCPSIAPIASLKRKLLVLDVNGLLAHIVMPAPKDCRGDTHILGRAIFKRPFCDDFLKFCFQNFDVGVWSSRSKRIIDRVVDYLLGDLNGQLLFCWDMDHSTQTGFKTLENIHKPLVCKELRRIWENDDPNLPWKKGDYNESNTLLLDDSPYKALLNPLHTAIFPNSYNYEDKNDKSLGPGGDLRVYLEGLLTSENVQQYVEQYPFGQGAINETSLSWEFYSGVLQTLSNRLEDNTPSSLPTLN